MTEVEHLWKHAEQSIHCMRSSLIPYQIDWTCVACKQKGTQTKKWTYKTTT